MLASLKLWTDAWQLGLDAQRVIAMRLARISGGGPAADAECRRMVSEKIAAAAAAQAAAASALAGGKGIEAAATAALAPVSARPQPCAGSLLLISSVTGLSQRRW
jgi:hypothetical protein